MSERIIKTGLGPRYKDMLDAVIGQMSDGYWENTPMMRGYWKFVTTGTSGNEVTLNVDTASGGRDGDRRIENRFYGMSDDAVKKFFADKIKFLVKEEVGPWERDNEATTDYLSYDKRYRVKDCYYAYEILKGRNARKHPEYSDVAESAVDEGKAYTFTWWDNEPTAERRRTTRADLKNCLHKETFNAADDDEALKTAVEYLCEYIGDDPEDVAATPKRIWDYFDDDWGFGNPIPMVLKQGSRVIKDSGFDPRKGDESRKNESSLETRLEGVAQVAGVIDYGDAWRLDRAAASDKDIRKKVRNLLSEFDDAAYDEDEAAMEKVAQQLKELADTVPDKSNEGLEDDPPEWRKDGCASSAFLERFEDAVKKSGLPWIVDKENSIYDFPEVYADITDLFGFNPSTEVGHIDYDSKDVSGNDAALLNIVRKCIDDIAPVELAFDGHDGSIKTVTAYMPHASMEGGYDAHVADDTWPTIPECIDMTMKALKDATDFLKKSGADLKAADSSEGKSRANEKRVMDTSEPYEISQIKEYMVKKGWTWNFNDKNNHFSFTKNGSAKIEGDLVPWSAYVITNGKDIYFGRSLRNWKADLKAIGLNEENSNESEGRMHLGRCKNCGHGWTKTFYLDELEPAVRKYFKDKGYPDNADICPKCVAAAKDYLAQGKTAGADESFEGWDGWEEVEGLEDTIDSIENLTYELRSCVRGAKTHCKDWKALALYIKGLASNLEDAAELMAYKTDESKKKSPSKKFSSTVEEDEDGRKLSH